MRLSVSTASRWSSWSRYAHLDCFGELPEEKVILADGTDATEEVLAAERWLIQHSF